MLPFRHRVQHWAQSTSMPPAALADLQAFLKTGDKLTYNITNELNRRFRSAILTVARAGNPEFLAGETDPRGERH